MKSNFVVLRELAYLKLCFDKENLNFSVFFNGIELFNGGIDYKATNEWMLIYFYQHPSQFKQKILDHFSVFKPNRAIIKCA